MAVSHSFDLENGLASWVTMKGSTLMKNRISSHLERKPSNVLDTVAEKLLLSLEIHLILCEWTDEHWRWYLNFIQEQLNATSRSLLSVTADPMSHLSERSENHESSHVVI